MLSPALGGLTAIWLMCAPALNLEADVRATLAIATGAIAFVLSTLGVWSGSARRALALLGLALALVNFLLPAPVEGMADFCTCALALIIAGMASGPVPISRSVMPAAAEPAVAKPLGAGGQVSRPALAAAA